MNLTLGLKKNMSHTISDQLSVSPNQMEPKFFFCFVTELGKRLLGFILLQETRQLNFVITYRNQESLRIDGEQCDMVITGGRCDVYFEICVRDDSIPR